MRETGKKQLIRNISSLFLLQVANYLLPFFSLPIIVRIIGPESFGIINYAAAIIAYFTLLINYGFNLTATRKVAQHPNDLEMINKIFNEVFGAKLVLFAVALFAFCAITVFIPDIRKNWEVMWFSFLICVAWVITPDWLFQGVQQLHKLAYFNFATKFIFTVIILLIIKRKEDYYLQPLAISASQILVAFFCWRYSISRFKLQITWPRLKKIREILWTDRIVFFSTVVINLYTTTNTVLLGILTNSTEVGYYTAAQRFITLAQTLISIPLSQSIFPYIGNAFGISKEQGLATARKIVPMVAVFTFFCALIMWLIGPWAIEIFYGDSFLPSKQMFRIMAFAPFIISLSNFFGIQVMLNLHMDKPVFRITAAGAVLSLLLNAVLTLRLGGIGTSYAFLITESFITIAMGLYLLSKNISIIHLHSFLPGLLVRQFKLLIAEFRK